MPSYRVTMTIGLLHRGVNPSTVLPAAGAAAAELTEVEAQDLTVVAGQPRIVVRYVAEHDDQARDVAGRVIGEVTGLAQVSASVVTRREGARWLPVTA
ncbi:hypothetical protein [Cellulomonas sp. NPDC089187]|uniref:hypothetical protein n=1 Tax=Cellulomonas sp. NPDC089187 TaxID=3154970 RepID=UPI00343432A4